MNVLNIRNNTEANEIHW